MRSQKSNRERWNSTWEYIQASRRRSRGSWPKCGWFDPNNDNNNNDNNINDNHTKRLLPWYCWLICKIALEAKRRWNKENPRIVTHLICHKPQTNKGLWKKHPFFAHPVQVQRYCRLCTSLRRKAWVEWHITQVMALQIKKLKSAVTILSLTHKQETPCEGI